MRIRDREREGEKEGMRKRDGRERGGEKEKARKGVRERTEG